LASTADYSAWPSYFLAFLLKSSIEERFMLEQFDQDYVVYRQQVRALIPFVF